MSDTTLKLDGTRRGGPILGESRPGRTVATAVVLIGVVAVGAILSMFFGGGGKGDGGGDGKGPADGQGPASAVVAEVRESDTRTASATLPADEPEAHQRPLRVMIRGSKYFVDEREVDLAAVKDLAAKVPEGSGPAVLIEPDESSRARAEEMLQQSLGEAKIRYAIEE